MHLQRTGLRSNDMLTKYVVGGVFTTLYTWPWRGWPAPDPLFLKAAAVIAGVTWPVYWPALGYYAWKENRG